VTVKEIKDSKGEKHKLIKLRNCWEGEEFTGRWSHYSTFLTPEIKNQLEYDPEEKEDFWMDIIDFIDLHMYKNAAKDKYRHNPIKLTLGQLDNNEF